MNVNQEEVFTDSVIFLDGAGAFLPRKFTLYSCSTDLHIHTWNAFRAQFHIFQEPVIPYGHKPLAFLFPSSP